jgi:hypothetical protein
MIVNHAQFIDAIREKNLVRIVFYSIADAGKVDRECVPLDYGPEPNVKDSVNRYWVWDQSGSTATNPLGLVPGQIVELRVLGLNFSPEKIPLGDRAWSVPRNWGGPPTSQVKAEPITPAK